MRRYTTHMIKVLMALMCMAVFSLAFTGETEAAGRVRNVTVTNLSSQTLTLKKGKTKTLKVKVASSGSTSSKVTYSSSNRKIVKVTSSGKVTAKKKGKAVITVTSKADKTKKTKITVTVGTPVSKVKLNVSKKSLKKGKTVKLKATVLKKTASNRKVVWSSSNTKVATVSKYGKVTAKKGGSAIITATAADGSGKKATCKITVPQLVTRLSLNKSSATILTGKSVTLKATASPSNATNKNVTWTSSNTSVAKVSSAGKVTGKKAGTATITAKAKDGSGKKASCTVTVKQAVTSISLSKTTASLNAGETLTLSATANPTSAVNRNVTWTSSKKSVATVSSNGTVTAKSAGTATITVTAKDGSGVTARCNVTVKPINVTKTGTYAGTVGTTTRMDVQFNDGIYDELDLSSLSTSDQSVCQVDQEYGVVMPIGPGSCVITAVGTLNGTQYTYKLTVNVSDNDNVKVAVDLSKYDGKVNFTTLKNLGTDYAIMRAGHGAIKDSKLKTYVTSAEAVDMDYGVYWFLESDDASSQMTTDEAYEQGVNTGAMLDKAGVGSHFRLPIYIDLEDETLSCGVKSSQREAKIQTLCESYIRGLTDAGYGDHEIRLYANKNYFTNYLNSSYFANYGIMWYARYNQAATRPSVKVGGKTITCQMWQTGDHYACDAVSSSYADYNYWYGNEA